MTIKDFKYASERWLTYNEKLRTALKRQFWNYLYACEMKVEEPGIYGALTKREAHRFEKCYEYWCKICELEKLYDNEYI